MTEKQFVMLKYYFNKSDFSTFNKFKYVLFADGNNVVFSCKTTNNVEIIVNIELNKIHKWLVKNKLSINMSKNKF